MEQKLEEKLDLEFSLKERLARVNQYDILLSLVKDMRKNIMRH